MSSFYFLALYDSLHWLRAVRAHVIIMIVLGGFGCLSNLASFAKQQDKNIKSSASLLLFLAGKLFRLVNGKIVFFTLLSSRMFSINILF